MDPLAIVVLVILGALGILASRIFHIDIEIGLTPPKFKITRHAPTASPGSDPLLPPDEPPAPSAGSEVERERDQLREALFRISEAAQALNALLEGDPAQADQYARDWFSSLASWLATSLRTSTTERYRVSIWQSKDDPDNFDAIGLGMFDPNDKRMRKLSRRGTIGGEAFHSVHGEKYCANIRDESCGWVPRSTPTPIYQSLFAVALGDARSRWGVMTIDCNQLDGFSEADRQVARHFGELALLGALIWRLKAEPPGTASRTGA